jgi:DNA-directed RNA polymerase sigma subunit (sigma70/sigma32)
VGKPQTIKQIASALKKTQEWVKQTEAQALERIEALPGAESLKEIEA